MSDYEKILRHTDANDLATARAEIERLNRLVEQRVSVELLQTERATADRLREDNAKLRIQVETMRNGLKPFAEALTRAEQDEPSDANARCGNCRERVTLYEFGQARKAFPSEQS